MPFSSTRKTLAYNAPFRLSAAIMIAFAAAILIAAVCASSTSMAWAPASPVKATIPASGTVPPYLRAEITGEIIPRSQYLPHALNELNKKARPGKGASFAIITRNLRPPRYLGKNQRWFTFVPVVFYGEGLKPVRRYTILHIENVEVEKFGESARHYVSNSPELLKETGTLLRGIMAPHEPVRYLVHHKNGLNEPLDFALVASNMGTAPARIELIDGGLEKAREESAPGHRTVLTFLKNRRNETGVITKIMPGETSAIASLVIKPGEILSGMGEIKLIEGENVSFAIKTITPGGRLNAMSKEIGEFQSFRGHGSFGSPHVDLRGEFVIGGKWKFITVGDPPLLSTNSEHTPLKGNYGVTHRIETTLINTQPQAEKVELMFSPVSGAARGILLVDGELIQIKSCKPPNTVKIKNFEVGPNEELKVVIETIPESGSFYPIRLVFRSRTIMPVAAAVQPASSNVD